MKSHELVLTFYEKYYIFFAKIPATIPAVIDISLDKKQVVEKFSEVILSY